MGGFSLEGFDKITSKALQNKFEKAKKISEDLGLTHDKIKTLEEATLNFAKTMVEAGVISKEKSRKIKRMIQLLDSCDKIFESKIDKLVKAYEKPDSNFSETYSALRNTKESEKESK